MDPSHSGGPDYDQSVAEVAFGVALKKGDERLRDVSGTGRMDLESNDTGVRGQLGRRPIAKMLIQSNKNAILSRAVFQDFQIVRACHARLRGALNVVARISKNARYAAIDHLVQEEAHGHLSRSLRLKLSAINHGMAVLQGRFDLLR